MILLAPIAAIVAGAIAAPLLAIMYMLRLRRRPVRVSTIMFWSDPPKDLEANVPLKLLRPAWTLLLQAIALALLALALGRPAIQAVSASSDRLYLLIDCSASMSARDAAQGRTRLDVARDQADRIIAGVGGLSGARAMLIPFASRAQSATPMTGDRAVLSAAVRSVEPTDEPGDLASALDLVGSLLTSQAGEGLSTSRARVILLSDGAFARSAARTLPGAALDYRPIGSAGAPDNLAIAALSARRDPEEPSRVRVFARVVSVRDQPTPATLVLTIDGQELARRAINIPASVLSPPSARAADADNPAVATQPSFPPPRSVGAASANTFPNAESREPGEQAIALEFLRPGGGVLRATIDRADALDADNAAAVVLPPVRQASILLVAPGEPDFFLRNVLEELVGTSLRVIDERTWLSPAGLEPTQDADLVIFDRVRPAYLPDRPTLSFGAGVPLPGLDSPPRSDDGTPQPDSAGSTGAAQWDRSHPALAGVSLDALLVSHPLALADPTTPNTVSSAPVRMLVSARTGPLIAEARVGPHRHIVVAFALRDSNWPISVGFPIFLASVVDDLVYAGDPGQAIAFRAGDPIPLRAALGPGIDPDQQVAALDGAARVVSSGIGSVVIPRIGVYTLRGRGIPESASVAVNLADEFESRLEFASKVNIAGESVAGAIGLPTPQELWFWFVLAAAVVLVVEWAVYLSIARA